jgi:hypothetical protein
MHACIHTYIHTYLHTYQHTYIPAYLHACIHKYIHTYIHTCICLPSFGAVLTAGSDLCVCVPCAFVACVFVLVCLCLFVLELSAIFTRAATPPWAKLPLLEIVVLSTLSPQPPFAAVLTAGSDLSLVSVFVCFVSCVYFVLCFCLSPSIHIHSLINCLTLHILTHSLQITLCFSVYLLVHTHTFA